MPMRRSTLETHVEELYGRTDETDDKPTLASHSDFSYLRPQPTERYPTARVTMHRVHRVIETYPPVPLDDGILYPVCQNPRRGGEVSVSGNCDGLPGRRRINLLS